MAELLTGSGVARTFETGATRDTNQGKLALEAFLSPEVLLEYAEYLNKHRHQSDGKLRAGDNWQKGIPLDVYIDSLIRHVFELWKNHRRGLVDRDVVSAVMFNAMGYMFELIRGNYPALPSR